MALTREKRERPPFHRSRSRAFGRPLRREGRSGLHNVSYYATGDGIRVGAVAPYPGVPQSRTETALNTGELVRLPSGAYAWRNFIYGRNAYCLRDSRTVTQLTLDLLIVHVTRILVTDTRFEADLPSRVSQQGEGVTSFNGKC